MTVGGGLYTEDSSPHFDHCLFQACHANTSGGGGYVVGICDVVFDHVVFADCDAGQLGGGLYISGTDPDIKNCTFYGNWAPVGGGGICCVSFASPHIVNTIITGSTSGSGLFNSSSPGLTLNYSCIYGNLSSNFSGTLPPGVGQITQVNLNGDSCDVCHNIYLNPLLVNPGSGNFQLQATSPCIDAGDPASPMDPDNTMADIGAFYYHQTTPSINVTMTPINPPINIPANGGSFQFNATVQRNVGPAAPFYAWARNRYPNGTYSGNLLGPVNVNPPMGVTVTRQRTQVVDAAWPAGANYYIGYANTTVAYPAIDADSFLWTKLTTADGGPTVWEVANYGEEFPYLVGGSSTIPTSFSLIGASPNPFNPSTTLSFNLPEAVKVALNVYDVQGRLVAQLVNGIREAGTHQVTFDGSNLSSGVYLVSLTAGANQATGKMVLMK